MTDPGLRRFLDDLDDLEAAVEDTSDPDRKASEILATSAQAHARKVSGFMAGSVHSTGRGVEADAVYAPIIHQGFRGITPNPFMTEALSDTQHDVEQVYLEHLEHELHAQIRPIY